jgi:hypothetical protein
MAPHAALCIPEILAIVLDNSVEDKSALAHSAQCCKAFLNPALDILWRDLPSVRPLQNLLPTLYSTDNGFTRKVKSPRKLIDPGLVARPHKYHHRT